MEDKVKDMCNEDVYYEFYEEQSQSLYNFLYYKYGSSYNPLDIVQEAFIKLWQNCKKVVFEKAKSYLFTIANNHALNEIAKEKTKLKYKETESHQSFTIESPQYLLEENEYSDRLKDALASLSEDLRATFLMNRVDGMKHQEIADLLGISRKAVEKRIYKALSIIREKIEGI